MTTFDPQQLSGLSSNEVEQQRKLHGANEGIEKENILKNAILSVIKEPMFLLLLLAGSIYLISGDYTEAITMLVALCFVAGIDVYQNFRSQRAISALNTLTSSKSKVVRNGQTMEIATKEVVTRDIIICEEGTVIPADAVVLASYDFSVNEAIITGESVSVVKQEKDTLIQGALVVGGYCYARVSAVGKKTTLAGIGSLVKETKHTASPLQSKVSRFVKTMVLYGSIAFVFVWGYHSWQTQSILQGLLHGLTMAMSVLPEELPVAFSTFMALGAYRLLKTGIIAKNPQTVETLGSATVICVDKTGTLTRNLMQVSRVYDFPKAQETNYETNGAASEVLTYAMWASEQTPFDPMEQSIHEYFKKYTEADPRPQFTMVHDFPLGGKPPVMTHIFENKQGERIIACKGALEGVLRLCKLSPDQEKKALIKGREYAKKGLRVLGVAKGHPEGVSLPEKQDDIDFEFVGLIVFNDPPDEHIGAVIQRFYETGVKVVMITGDYPETAEAIAKSTGIKTNRIVTGAALQTMDEAQLIQAVAESAIFARIAPEQKLRIIEALKKRGEIVAMTGDGVNDAPALKAAHIGVSMGKRGTDVAKEAAGLILSNDNMGAMVDAIFLGRRINENLKKAFRYIITIHIPIILLVTAPIFLGWLPTMLFTPIHVIFLELIMGPTCSIIYENEPMLEKSLLQPIDHSQKTLLKNSELWLTILQGVIITLGCLVSGYVAVQAGGDENYIRAFVFGTLIFSNIFLTLVNRSFKESVLKTIAIKNKLIPLIIGISLVLLLLINYVPFIHTIFDVTRLHIADIALIGVIGLVSTIWIEFFKRGRAI